MIMPFNLHAWLDKNQDKLKPPVGNYELFPEGDYIVMAVGGPNQRKDFHINQGPEFFYQIKGDIELRILEDGKPKTLAIREGDVFVLPANVPHSPQRGADSIGLVIEQKRRSQEKDGFVWICDQCDQELYREYVQVHDIVAQLPKVFSNFYDNPSLTTCTSCGHQAKKQ